MEDLREFNLLLGEAFLHDCCFLRAAGRRLQREVSLSANTTSVCVMLTAQYLICTKLAPSEHEYRVNPLEKGDSP